MARLLTPDRDDQHQRMIAKLIAGLEEDYTGRTPIDPALISGDAWGDHGYAHFFWMSDDQPIGYAVIDTTSATAQCSLLPHSRPQAQDFLAALRQQTQVTQAWARGQQSASATLPGDRIRRLAILSRSLAANPASGGPDPRLRPFNPTTDTDAWLKANAEIFVALPDQANTSRGDLTNLQEQPWFDPDGLLVAVGGGGDILGFHWTKLTADERLGGVISGEVYVLGVRGEQQGSGLATGLLNAGLQHLQARGARQVHLWVESDNFRAISFYNGQGFDQVDSDVLIALC